MTTKSNKHSLFLTLREPFLSRTVLQALTLVKPTRENSVLAPVAALHLDNRLYIFVYIITGSAQIKWPLTR